MLNQKWLKFTGLNACVFLEVDPGFTDALDVVFSNWPYELTSAAPEETLADIVLADGRYRISSPHMSAPETYSDPLNTLCRLVVELAWARLRENPELLCLHGAAVEVNGRLVVFPSTRRAGKSTLCVAMMAAGFRVFTDDFLPLQIDEQDVLCGISQGISPRLRRPVPDQIGPRAKAYLGRQSFIENRQYRYVWPKAGDAAEFGKTAPLGALVFLERTSGAVAEIGKISQAEALQALIRQNFSRAMNAAAILNILSAIARNIPAYRLQYDEVEEAVEHLRNRFGQWQEAPVAIRDHDFAAAPAPDNRPQLQNWKTAPLLQKPGIAESIVDNKRFLSGRNNRNILYLNEGATAIWRLLSEPTTLPEIVELLVAAYPEQDPGRIEGDAEMTIKAFVENQLVEESGPLAGEQIAFGNYVDQNADRTGYPKGHAENDRS